MIAEMSAVLVKGLFSEVVFSTVVFGVVFLLCRGLRRRGPALRCALWTLVFVRLVLPPDLTHPWSAGAMAGRLLPSSQLLEKARDAAPSDATSASPPRALTLPGSHSRPASGLPWPVGPAVFWLAGAAAGLFVYWRRCRVYRTVIREAPTVTDPRAEAVASSWRKSLGIRRPVRLVSSRAPVSPFTAGVLRPVVFLPRPVLDDAALLEPVLAHELAHVARWDSLWLLLQNVVQAVYFFHPVVWLAGRRLDQERERTCDALVLGDGRVSRRDYAASLLAVLKLSPRGLAVPHLITRKRRYAMRLSSILEAERRGALNPRAAMVAAFVLGLFLLPLAGGDLSADTPPTPQEPPAETQSDPGLVNPLPGSKITWGYGEGKDPWTREKVLHKGIDLAADFGTPILAPAAGVVKVATTSYERGEAFGTVIIVDHGSGLETFYAHLGELKVAEGQSVTRHEVLAEVGSTGRSTGPHLHFETWRDGELVDPAELVSEWDER